MSDRTTLGDLIAELGDAEHDTAMREILDRASVADHTFNGWFYYEVKGRSTEEQIIEISEISESIGDELKEVITSYKQSGNTEKLREGAIKFIESLWSTIAKYNEIMPWDRSPR